MSSNIRCAAALLLSVATALGGFAATAHAGGKKHGGHHAKHGHHGKQLHRSRVVIVGTTANDCSVYYAKWKHTGSGVWKGRYYSCLYGW